jgi:hypothetical protein
MTSLAAVLSVDSRGPAGLYLMTDSRITWKGYDGEWDAGQKTYFASNQAHIFGFCGDAAFPPSVARQLIEQIEAGIIGLGDDPDVVRADILAGIEWAHAAATNKFFDGFSLFHGYREGCGMKCNFHLWRYQYFRSTDKLYFSRINLDATTSCLAHIDGSGKSTIQHFRDTVARGVAASTSRAAVWTFYDALLSGNDRATGGAPQLVGLWRAGPAQRFGVIWQGARYVAGIKLPSGVSSGTIHWFDDKFESLGRLPPSWKAGAEPA